MPRPWPACWVHFDRALEPLRMCSGRAWAHAFTPNLEDPAMPRGRYSRYQVTLTLPERRQLEALQRQTVTHHDVTRRARVLLLLAEGETITDIAYRVGMSRKHVYKWITRFLDVGMTCLWAKPGRWHSRREGASDG